jgi:hypothetical protein
MEKNSMIPNALVEKFHPSLVKKNQSGQDYVAINDYINRLNDVLGHAWAWQVNDWKLYPDAAPPTKNGKPQYLAVVQGSLSIYLNDVGVISIGGEDDEDAFLTTQKAVIVRDGIGSNINFDPDTAVKSAQAEALKKACHQYGIALYLWDEAERDFVALQKSAATNDIALKQLVLLYTQRVLELEPGVMPEKEQMCEVLGIEDLTVENIRESFSKKGVI